MINFCLLVALVFTQVLGDIWLSWGMKLWGSENSISLFHLADLVIYLFTSPWIALGVLTLTVSLLLYLVSVSRLDLSYVLPIHASSYVLNALLAKLILEEDVSISRWLAAILISFGVFLVGLSQQQSPQAKSSSGNSLFLFFPFGLAISQLWWGSVLLALSDAAGDVLTAKGIKQVGECPGRSPHVLFPWLWRVISNPLMLLGIGGYTGAFLIFLSLLSWADISLVRPATAIGYLFSILGAKFWLQERITGLRWAGIVPIGLGIILVSKG